MPVNATPVYDMQSYYTVHHFQYRLVVNMMFLILRSHWLVPRSLTQPVRTFDWIGVSVCGHCSGECVISVLVSMRSVFWPVFWPACGQCSGQRVVSVLVSVWTVFWSVCGQCSGQCVVSVLASVWPVFWSVCGSVFWSACGQCSGQCCLAIYVYRSVTSRHFMRAWSRT